MAIPKIQLNNAQVELVKSWIPDGSQPYGYNPVKGILWFWMPHYSGVVVKNAVELSDRQLEQLNQLVD